MQAQKGQQQSSHEAASARLTPAQALRIAEANLRAERA